MIIKVLSNVGSFASLIGLVATLKDQSKPFNDIHWMLIILSAILFIVSMYKTVSDYFKSKPKIYKTAREIRDYMYKWISGGGRVVIFTRDMSWVSDTEMIDMLSNKSSRGECIICLPRKIEITNRLELLGATVIEYSDLNYVPLSRFTIINYGRNDAKVAVGKAIDGGEHLVEEYGNGQHPYFHVANDLVRILESRSQ